MTVIFTFCNHGGVSPGDLKGPSNSVILGLCTTPVLFQPHVHTSLGPGIWARSPDSWAPGGGWLLQAADISHIPPQGQMPSLHWLLMSCQPQSTLKGRKEEGGRAGVILSPPWGCKINNPRRRGRLAVAPQSSAKRTKQHRSHVCLIVTTERLVKPCPDWELGFAPLMVTDASLFVSEPLFPL